MGKKRGGKKMTLLKVDERETKSHKFVRSNRTNEIYNNLTSTKIKEINEMTERNRGYSNISREDLYRGE